MRKRIISIAFSALMIMSVLVVMDIVPVGHVSAVQNRPHDDGSGNGDDIADDHIFATNGDWTIQVGETWEYSPSGSASEPKPCETIIVNGHLTIEEAGASLILKGVTLLMNCSYDGQYNITVEAADTFPVQGSLIIEDVDDNPSTPDGSIITSYDGVHRFGFIVEGAPSATKVAASLQFKNSELHNCGWNATESENYMDAGLWIGGRRGTSGITISNNTISDNYVGITLFQTTGTASININDNEILDSYLGIYLNDTTIPLNIRNNDFSGETTRGIFGTSSQILGLTSRLTLEGNTFSNLRGDGTDNRYAAVSINGSTDPTVRNNVLSNNQDSGIIIFNADGYGTLTNNVFNDVEFGTGFQMGGVNGLYAAYNSAKAHPTAHSYGTGLAFSDVTGDVEIVNNDVRGFDWNWYIDPSGMVWIIGGFGIFLRGEFAVGAPGQANIIASDNVLWDNKAWGLYLDLQNYDPIGSRTIATMENNNISRTGAYDLVLGYIGEGINVEGGNTQIIMRNNWVNDSVVSGIYVEDEQELLTQEVICENNDVLSNDRGYGVYIEGEVITIQGNTVNNNGNDGADDGIYAVGDTINIQGNTANNNEGDGIYAVGDTINIQGNTANNNEGDGIYAVNMDTGGSGPITVTNNIANDNGGIGISTYNFGGGTVTITDNEANRNTWNGIMVWGNETGARTTTMTVTNNDAQQNGKLGIAVAFIRPPTDNRGYVADNIVTGNGHEDVEHSGGMGVEFCNSIDIFNNTITDNRAPLISLYDAAGVWVRLSNDIIIEECPFDNNDWGVYSKGGTDQIWVVNCSITNSDVDDFFLANDDGDSHVITLNTTFDSSSVAVANAASDLTCMWYMHVRVRKTGTWQNGAEVTILNITGDLDPSSGQPFTTSTMDGQPGWIKWLKVTEFVQRGATRFMHTPHLAHATYTDAGKPMEGMATPSMDKSKVIIIDLNYIPQIVDFAPGYDVINRTYPLYFYLNATDPDPGGDPEDALDVYLEYRDPNELSWNTSYIGTAQYVGGTPPDGYFKIPFTPQSNFTVGWYDFRVRVRDSYHSYSDWTEAFDMVYVANNIPVVTYAKNGSASVYRGNTINVWADANDIEDIDDQYFTSATAAIFQYKAPGGNWDDAYLGPEYLYSNDWRAEFTPPGQPTTVTPIGKYSFQFKFIDNDGNESVWYQKDDWIEVLNNPPVVDNLKAGYSSIYRDTEQTYIYANVTEVEDDEKDDLTVVFEHYHPDLGWGTQYLGTPTYVGTSPTGFWTVLFDPDETAPVGSYNFRVTVTDLDGDSVVETEGGLVQVKNHLPEVEDVRASSDSVRRGAEFIYIEVDASDREDPESSLQLIVQYWDTESQSWETDYIGNTIWDDRGWLKVKFEPDSNAPTGKYDFRVKVRDTDGGESTDWYPANELVVVQNPEPALIEVKLEDVQVYRGDTLYITVNAKDPVDSEKDLKVELQYRHEDKTGWTDITVLPSHYEGSDDETGYWKIPFTPDKNFETGKYYFHCRVKNSAQTYSNNGQWNTTDPITDEPLTADVLNKRPVASNLRVEGANTVERGGSITIKADGTDFEDDEDDLDAIFEYKSDGSWEDTYLGPADYQGGSWVVEFKPPANKDVPLGEYDFQVYFVDRNDGQSDPIEKSDLVDVQNVIPTVKSILVPSTSGYRLEPITITAEATDPDNPVGEVVPTFQYKGPSGDWVDVDDPGSYFQDQPDLLNERWQITFKPPADADIGDYRFQVSFSDGLVTEDELVWEEFTDTYEVMNNDPEVEIQTSGVQKSTKVTFEAIASDPEGEALTWVWDFGDGETSTEESPTHTYKEAKSYTVEVTVTDSEGGTADQTINIIIEGDGGGGIDMMTLLLILIPLIAAILVLILLLTMKKKKKPEEVPPAVPGAAPTAPPAAPGAPPAPPAPAAVPAAAPAPPPAAPAAVPAAVPAAAPAAAPAGQQIKCPKCGTAFRVESAERPITIECPNCHAKGKLT